MHLKDKWDLKRIMIKIILKGFLKSTKNVLNVKKSDLVQDEIKNKIWKAIGPCEDLFLTTVKKHKLQWHGHVSRSTGLAKQSCNAQYREGGEVDREKKMGRQHI